MANTNLNWIGGKEGLLYWVPEKACRFVLGSVVGGAKKFYAEATCVHF